MQTPPAGAWGVVPGLARCLPTRTAGVLLGVALLAGCISKPMPRPPAPAPAPQSAPVPPPPPPLVRSQPPAPTPAAPAAPVYTPPSTRVAPLPAGARVVKQPPPLPARNLAELRLQAARRMVATLPDSTYMTVPRQPLLGVPVLKISLNGDGSVRDILVLREPAEAKHVIKMAIDAVHRAAPYGDVRHLPGPWEFIETFLFENNERFKPMTLDR